MGSPTCPQSPQHRPSTLACGCQIRTVPKVFGARAARRADRSVRDRRMDAFTLVRTDGASTTCRDGDCNNLVAARWCLRPAYALRTHVARGDPACPARAFAAPRPPNHALALAHSQDGLTKDGSTRASQSLRVARRCGPCLGPTLPRLLLGQRTAVGSSLHRHERAGAPRRAVLCHATKAPRHAHSQIVHPSPRPTTQIHG